LSLLRRASLDATDCIIEARLITGISVSECIELCDITERTWYRWIANGAPRWAIRLVLSQLGTLDRFGWKDWEIRSGVLYCNQLHHRYHWEPVNLLLPLYGIRDSALGYAHHADNLSSIEAARKKRTVDKSLKLPKQSPTASQP
jgi:hypothetical protein